MLLGTIRRKFERYFYGRKLPSEMKKNSKNHTERIANMQAEKVDKNKGVKMKGFSEFCDEYNITHIAKRALPFYLFNKSAMDTYVSKEMLDIAIARLSGRKNAILDIHLLGLDELRVSIAFAVGSWHYGFGTGHKFAVPNKCIEINKKELQDLQAEVIIVQEMRKFIFSYIKRKPYVLLKPSVLKAIKIC